VTVLWQKLVLKLKIYKGHYSLMIGRVSHIINIRIILRHYSTIKSQTNAVLNCTGAPGNTWLWCLKYVCYIYNHVAIPSLDWKKPLSLLTGETTDISILLHFSLREEVYYSKTSTSFPSKNTEELGITS
jgi:hypothetical protein